MLAVSSKADNCVVSSTLELLKTIDLFTLVFLLIISKKNNDQLEMSSRPTFYTRMPQRHQRVLAGVSQASYDDDFGSCLTSIGLRRFKAQLEQGGVCSVEALTELHAAKLSELTGLPPHVCAILVRKIECHVEQLRALKVEKDDKEAKKSSDDGRWLQTSHEDDSRRQRAASIGVQRAVSRPPPARPSSSRAEIVRSKSPIKNKKIESENSAIASSSSSSPPSSTMSVSLNRLPAVLEIVESERRYLSTLRSLLDDYLPALRQLGVLSPEDEQLLFGGLQTLADMSAQLCDRLDTVLAQNRGDPAIGRVMLAALDGDQATQHFGSFILRNVVRQRRIAVFDASMLADVGGGRTALESALAAPFQRVCRFPLLLQQVFKRTDVDHRDHAEVSAAFDRSSRLADDINEQMRQQCRLQAIEDSLYGSDLESLRETGAIDPNESAKQSKHRWIKKETVHVATRCAVCRQIFHWPKDNDSLRCVQCGVQAHKLCSKQYARVCAPPQLVTNTRRYTGRSWFCRHAPKPQGKRLKRRASVFLFNDSILITTASRSDSDTALLGGVDDAAATAAPATAGDSGGSADDASVPSKDLELIVCIRWYSSRSGKFIDVQQISETRLLVTSPRATDGSHKLECLDASVADAIRNVIAAQRKQWIAENRGRLARHAEIRRNDTQHRLGTFAPSSSSGSVGSALSSSSSSSSSMSSMRALAAAASASAAANAANGCAQLNLTRGNVRFSVPQTVQRPIGADGPPTTCYCVVVNVDGKFSFSIVARRSQLQALRRTLRKRFKRDYKQVFKRHDFPSDRCMLSANPMKQQRACMLLQRWFNQLQALDVAHSTVDRFFSEHSEVDDDDESERVRAPIPVSTPLEAAAATDCLPRQNSDDVPTQFLESTMPSPSPRPGRAARALWAFDAVEDGELSVAVGERVRVLHDDGTWANVLNSQSQCGWVALNFLSLGE
jgi:RhoGEF domain